MHRNSPWSLEPSKVIIKWNSISQNLERFCVVGTIFRCLEDLCLKLNFCVWIRLKNHSSWEPGVTSRVTERSIRRSRGKILASVFLLNGYKLCVCILVSLLFICIIIFFLNNIFTVKELIQCDFFISSLLFFTLFDN